MRNFGGVQNVDQLAGEVLRRVTSNLAGLMAGNKESGFKHDASGTPATTGFVHGPNGLFRTPGTDPQVFSTMVGHMSINSLIPWTPSVYMNPLFQTFTGITDGDTDERDEVCEDAPTGGVKKGCITMAPFGWIQRGTQEVDVTRLGQRLDRGEPVDQILMGSPLDSAFGIPGSDQFANLNLNSQMLINEWTNLLTNRNVALYRKLARLNFTGDPANNTNGYMEYPGLQKLVTGPVGGPGTGTAHHRDALTGDYCPSMDSLVLDYDYARIDQNMGDLVSKLTYMTRYLKSLARRTGLDPTTWVMVMPEPLFYEVTRAYACAYYLNGSCPVVDEATQRLFLDARSATDLRDQMFNGQFLIIDGMRWNVAFDDGIPVESQTDTAELESGCFASDIYILPLTVMGGTAVLRGEYYQFDNPSMTPLFGAGLLGRVVGAYLEVPRQKNNCFVLDVHLKPRILLRTPHLAAKLTNVAYCPPLNVRQPFPDDPYYVNGGVTGSRAAPTYPYNVWDN